MIRICPLPSGLPYSRVLSRQEEEFNYRISCRRQGLPSPDDIIFLVEHQPVFTLGRHGDLSHLLLSRDILQQKNIEFVEINRGGDITYHGPGQLTVYPIIDLLRYRLGVKEYVSLLEQAVIDTIGAYGIRGERIEGKTGVWIGKGTSAERKISAIGIKCSRFFTMHGVAVNVASDLGGFSGIVPCGLPQGVTSVSREIGREIPVDEVGSLMASSLIRLLQLRIPSQGIS